MKNPLKRYFENQLLTQVLLQTLVISLNDNTIAMNTLCLQLKEISKKQPVEQTIEYVTGMEQVN